MLKRSICFLYLSIFLLSLSIMVISCSIDNPPTNTISSIAVICLEPKTCWGVVGQNFTVNINISDVVDLYGWEFKLSWNATILDTVEVLEGPFLKNGGNTYFTSKINNTLGYMIVDCTLLGNVYGVNGSGTLTTIKFYVKTFGECQLDLYDTILVNSAEQPIEHIAIDGYYYTLVRDVAIIDLTASSTCVNVTVENQGTCTETFNVSVYFTRLGDPLIGTQTITLNKGENATLSFIWSPPIPGLYEIRAEASILWGEADTLDNVYTIVIQIGRSISSSNNQYESIHSSHYFAFAMFILGLIVLVPKAFNKNGKTQTTVIHISGSKLLLAENVWQHLIRQLRNLQ